jgi:hypothetical protein
LQKRVPYLGHYVSQKGIETDPKKISAITNWPEINNIKKLHAFLGLTGYYRKFIKGYSQIALPLTKLLQGEIKWEWTEAQEDAKQQLIKQVTEAPVLIKLDLSKPITLTTDASEDALGAVISQNGQPAAFLSKSFHGAECYWPIYEKEFYAIIYAFEHWEHWLLGSHVIVITDNNAVTHFQSQKKLSPKVA